MIDLNNLSDTEKAALKEHGYTNMFATPTPEWLRTQIHEFIDVLEGSNKAQFICIIQGYQNRVAVDTVERDLAPQISPIVS